MLCLHSIIYVKIYVVNVMLVTELKRSEVSRIANDMSENLIKFPLFMFFCMDMTKRQSFIKDYFAYHLLAWLRAKLLYPTVKGFCNGKF